MSGDGSGEQPLRYDFEVTAASTYARVARMVGAMEAPGLVVDLGAGVGALGAALGVIGFDYLGLAADPANVAAMVDAGLDAGPIDLRSTDVVELVRSEIDRRSPRRVAAITLLDVVEHLPDPEELLDGVRRLVAAIGERQGTAPLLVLSIPNVAHIDLAGKLVTGRWDVTEVGLLDSTHVSLFTEDRLERLVADLGFVEAARDDVVRRADDQCFPRDHPAQVDTPLAAYLRYLRDAAGPGAETYQFVRAYRLDPGAAGAHDRVAPPASATAGAPDGDGTGDPFLSVVVRTQGRRATLLDTLTCLAAQDDGDFEVLLMVDDPDVAVVGRVEALVEPFDPSFRARLHVHHVTGGGRSRPLNAALERAHGRYFAILDDDDVVTAGWVSAFRRCHERMPGRMLRAACVVQSIERRDGALADHEVTSGFRAVHPETFDLLDAVRANRSPSCSYALPMGTIGELGLRFDETLRVCEDWKLEIEVARVAGVSSDPEVTSIYRRWTDGGGSDGLEDTTAWIEDHERVLADLDRVPTLVPPGSLTRIHRVYEYVEELERRLGLRGAGDPPYRPT